MERPVTPQAPAQDGRSRPCYLGDLAPEIFDLILLQISSVRALANFIYTAHFVYRRFHERKLLILWRVLHNELGPVLTDARFLRQFPYAGPGHPHEWDDSWDRIYNAGALYRDMLAHDARPVDATMPQHAIPDITELTQLCHIHYDIDFLASTYVSLLLRTFGSEKNAVTAPLSHRERLRVLRAFYRRQIISNAWAPGLREMNFIDEDAEAMSNTSDHNGVRLGFFAAFEPWELQQIDHANKFIDLLCAAICHVRAELEQPRPQPFSKEELGKLFSHVDYLVRYLRTHTSLAGPIRRALPSLLGTLEHDVAEAEGHLMELVSRQIDMLPFRSAWQGFCVESFPDPAREQREAISNNEGDHGEGVSLDFVGDAVDLPPFGWVDALNGRYLNWFGEGLSNHPRLPQGEEGRETRRAMTLAVELWRAAGLTLWDRRRVEAFKELDKLKTFQTGWAVCW